MPSCAQRATVSVAKSHHLQIDPDVPWYHAKSETAPGYGLHLKLKSGKFCVDAFFAKAFKVWACTRPKPKKKYAALGAAYLSVAMCTPPKTKSKIPKLLTET